VNTCEFVNHVFALSISLGGSSSNVTTTCSINSHIYTSIYNAVIHTTRDCNNLASAYHIVESFSSRTQLCAFFARSTST
jgi:hypothetical protein